MELNLWRPAMIGFWIFMLIMCLIIPITMIGFGKYFLKGGPKDINGVFGYRTSRSMKNKDTWEYAHKISGKIWFVCGLILLPLSVVAMILFFGKSIDTIGYAGMAITTVQIIIMACSIFPTEAALKRTFDNNGNRR